MITILWESPWTFVSSKILKYFAILSKNEYQSTWRAPRIFQSVLRIRYFYSRSRILIFTHPGSRIQKQQQKRGVKKNLLSYLLCSHKFHKIENYFSFEVLKKKICANFQRIIELFTQKIVTKLSKIWVWDPGSAIRKKPIQDHGSKGQKGTGSRIRIRNTDFNHEKRELSHSKRIRVHPSVRILKIQIRNLKNHDIPPSWGPVSACGDVFSDLVCRVLVGFGRAQRQVLHLPHLRSQLLPGRCLRHHVNSKLKGQYEEICEIQVWA